MKKETVLIEPGLSVVALSMMVFALYSQLRECFFIEVFFLHLSIVAVFGGLILDNRHFLFTRLNK